MSFLFSQIFSLMLLTSVGASPSADSRAEDLEDDLEFQQHTLAPPLLGAAFDPGFNFQGGASLFNSDHEPGHWGDLAYEPVGEKSFRLHGRDLKKPSGFFWLFENPQDLRDRWVEIVYSGLSLPSQMALSFDSRMPRKDVDFVVPLKNSFEPKSGFFKLPDRDPFSKITKLGFNFDPKDGKDVEMLLLDLRVLPEGSDPLRPRSAPDAA